MSTSSPATRNCGSKPPIASRRIFRNAMLQPGMCSASRSESRTWIGPPGALATHCATGPSSGGGMFGPPMPTWSESLERGDEVGEPVRIGTGVVVDVGDDLAGRPLEPEVAGGASPRFSVGSGGRPRTRSAIAAVPSVEPSSTTITS